MSSDDTSFTDPFQPYQFTDAQLLAIGRLVRACAEIEEIVDVHLCNVAEITEGQMIVLLGQTSAARKIKIAEVRAKALGEACIEAHRTCFNNEHYLNATRCRNAVAHGQLLGLTKENKVALLVSEIVESQPDFVVAKVRAYGHADFEGHANVVEQLIPQFDQILRTKALREKRRAQFRARLRSPQGSKQPGSKQRPPRQSSRKKSQPQ